MLKPIYKILHFKLEIVGFYLYINIYLNKPCSLFKTINNTQLLPNELCNEIISYLPDKFELVLRLDIPNTFPIYTIFISFEKLNNTFMFQEYNFKDEIDYIKFKIKKVNTKYSEIDNRSNIDFDYLKAHSIDYLTNEINRVYDSFSQIQCVH